MLVAILLASSANAMEVFEKHLMSQVKMSDMTHKIIAACLLETEIKMCKVVGDTKKIINGTASYAVDGAKDTAYLVVDYFDMRKPVAVAGYIAKVIIDKKIRINKFRKLPILNNDNGALEFSDTDIMWTLGWNF